VISTTTRARILVVDDDDDVRDLVRLLLERAAYDVSVAADGREGLRQAYALRPDLIVLDLAMPELTGWQALDRIRDLSDVPILVLTASSSEAEKVRGLRGGADDYVTKPFGRQELLARIDVLLRRPTARSPAPEVLDDGFLRVDFGNRRVEVHGEEIALTPLEYKLMAVFARHPHQVLSRDQLLELVWNDSLHTSADQVKLYVGYLRRKLEPVSQHLPIETVRGFGYRYRPHAALRRSA
jgi:DNA-binding response OmpR family regulator